MKPEHIKQSEYKESYIKPGHIKQSEHKEKLPEAWTQ